MIVARGEVQVTVMIDEQEGRLVSCELPVLTDTGRPVILWSVLDRPDDDKMIEASLWRMLNEEEK